jgi:tetratricopeptide (TPR) repeat protein
MTSTRLPRSRVYSFSVTYCVGDRGQVKILKKKQLADRLQVRSDYYKYTHQTIRLYMLARISLWVGAIAMGSIVTILPSTAIAKSSVESTHSVKPIAVAVARVRRQGSSGNYFTSAAQKYQQGDYQGALNDYNRAIQINPRNANAYYNRGLLKATKFQDAQGALADYNRAIKIKPSYDAAYNNRANLKVEQLKDYQGALADYNQAIKLKPRNADAYYNRGVLKYTLLTDRSGGIADMQQAVKLSQRQANSNYQAASDLLKEWQQTTGK